MYYPKINTAINISSAGAQCISTADAAQHIHVDYSDTAGNTEIDNMVQAATAQVELYTSRKCMPTTVKFYLSRFPINGIVLPFSPVTAVTSIKYYDSSNAQQTLAASEYYYDLNAEPCVIRYVNNAFNATYPYRDDAVEITITCGYANEGAVPKEVRQSILILTDDLYNHRGDVPRERFSLWQMICYSRRVFHTPYENAW